MRVFVTRTGRAISPGRTTRKSLAVRRPKGRPLPFVLQCHPPALVRTSLNPGCCTYLPVGGATVRAERARTGDTSGYAFGHGLDGHGPVTLHVQGWGTYRHGDLVAALGWARAAKRAGFTVQVFDERYG